MIVRQILKSKGSTVVAVPAVEPIANIATLLTESRIGAVVVRNAIGNPVGILSERDIVEGLANQGASVLDATAEELMTSDIISCSPDDHIDGLMQVLERGRLAGIISIGDLVKARIGELETEGEALQRYIGAGA